MSTIHWSYDILYFYQEKVVLSQPFELAFVSCPDNNFIIAW